MNFKIMILFGSVYSLYHNPTSKKKSFPKFTQKTIINENFHEIATNQPNKCINCDNCNILKFYNKTNTQNDFKIKNLEQTDKKFKKLSN